MNARAVVFLALSLPLLACQRSPSSSGFSASGHVEATQVRLASKVSGTLLEVRFQEGETLNAGDVMARLDTAQLQRELEKAKAQRDAAAAELALLEAGARAEEIAEAQARLKAAQAELAAAQADVARYQPLAQKGAANRKLLEDAETKALTAAQQVKALEARLQLLQAGARSEEKAAARARLAAAEAQVKVLEQVLADSVIVSPIAGTVIEKLAEPGEFLPAGTPVVVVADLTHPWLEVYVDEPHLAHLRLGQTVKVKVDGRTETFEGVVSFIAPQPEFTPKNVQTPDERAKLVFKVKVALENPNGVFKPGMPADALFSAP
ncbi:MAG: hemolysin secretion protein D [Thermoanaerobaculum sp.]|nr:MAG: hemolysin secretion protein D [Thermoanaerobaculum sp.]